jgi:protein-tyrosine-phosphatase
MGSVRTVVFVCQHGAAKSVLAAALLERLAAEQGVSLRARARGTEPEP